MAVDKFGRNDVLMSGKKLFILLPDGVGLRNFAFSQFYDIGKKNNYQVTFWNNTPFNLSELDFDEIKFPKNKIHPLTDIFKNAVIQASLNYNAKVAYDKVYDDYKFPPNRIGFKNKLRNFLVSGLTLWATSGKKIQKLRKAMYTLETKTAYYQECLQELKTQKPDFVFCTNQRPVVAIAPILAAQNLNIPTATFIFSWDNLPKATMVIQTDYYFVWSEHMKKELLHYYPNIQENQVVVTGTPQFEAHLNPENGVEKASFFEQYGLDLNKKYICYSGDDITTCPDDAQYLNDVAQAVENLNQKGHHLGIIFRRCPVDFSDRYDAVLQKFKGIIVPIHPAWEKKGEGWNTILPTKKDNQLLVSTAKYTEMVINLGSSMVFDFSIFDKPCAFINYDVQNKKRDDWSVQKIYKFVHFRSMPSHKAVVWLNDKESISEKIVSVLSNSQDTVQEAQKWMRVIAQSPYHEASHNIYKAITAILAHS